MTSAPACTKLAISSFVMMCSPCSARIPAACILPAASISRSPTAARIDFSELVIASLLMPLPGLPVSTTMLTPMSAANTAFSGVARRPADIAHSVSSLVVAAPGCTGSRLIPNGRPVRRRSSRTVSAGATFAGRPCTTGASTSNIFSNKISAPMALTNSALVTSTSSGMVKPMHSQASTRPSLAAMLASKSRLLNRSKSEATQSSILFTIQKLLCAGPAGPCCFAAHRPWFILHRFVRCRVTVFQTVQGCLW